MYAAWLLETPVAVKKFERAEDSLHEVEMYLQLGSHDNVVALRCAAGLHILRVSLSICLCVSSLSQANASGVPECIDQAAGWLIGCLTSQWVGCLTSQWVDV